LNWGHFLQPLKVGQGNLTSKVGVNLAHDDGPRLNLSKGMMAKDFVTLKRPSMDQEALEVTNHDKKRNIWIRGLGLSSPMEVKPGETKPVLKEQTIVIGPLEFKIVFP
jgi:hypothetical protein